MVDRRPNIWKLQANQDIDGLCRALAYSDPDIRKRAAAALRALGATEAVDYLRQALQAERQPDVREHLMAALTHLDGSFSEAVAKEKKRDALIQKLSTSHDAKELIEAAQQLGELGDQLATEALVTLFRNTTQPDRVRLAAAKALLNLKSAPSVVTLLAGLKKDNWRVRHNAAAVLGQLRATWATEPLIEALSDPHPNVRLAAAAALHRFQTRQALEALALYQKRRTGQTKPLPHRPDLAPPISSKPEKDTAPSDKPSPQPNTTMPRVEHTKTREIRVDPKRQTQQIMPRLPILPKTDDEEDENPSSPTAPEKT
ncbi:MAG: hypothetical protein CUN55_10160 [Phototrophicales bacterium]|nr:MAG: hypothetical protein CUN55_10160 [Phototrophicales bacterium]